MFTFGQYKDGNENDIALLSKLVPLIGNFTESGDQNSFFGYGGYLGQNLPKDSTCSSFYH